MRTTWNKLRHTWDLTHPDSSSWDIYVRHGSFNTHICDMTHPAETYMRPDSSWLIQLRHVSYMSPAVNQCESVWISYSPSHWGCHVRKLKAQSSKVSFATFQWKETFELWALNFETAFENVIPSGIGCTRFQLWISVNLIFYVSRLSWMSHICLQLRHELTSRILWLSHIWLIQLSHIRLIHLVSYTLYMTHPAESYMTHPAETYMRHDSSSFCHNFWCVQARLRYIYHMTYMRPAEAYMRHDSSSCGSVWIADAHAARPIHTCDMTHSYVWHDAKQECAMQHLCAQKNGFSCDITPYMWHADMHSREWFLPWYDALHVT